MKKDKILIYLMMFISLLLCIPSISYLITNQTVDGFDSFYTYTLTKPSNGRLNGIIVIGLLLLFSILYFLVLKRYKSIFKNRKQMILWVVFISIVFTLILPFLSADIYYYIGDSWLAAKYHQNPYYVTVSHLQEKGINDEILANTGYWSNTTSVYGPLWNSIARLLVNFSFGSVTIALFIFKLVALLIHIINSILIRKITKSDRYLLLYGLNPLILIEFLSNVHNDIYLILFILLALYFLIRKKNSCFTLLFLALSISIKYSTALIVPFILLYCFRKKTIPKRILFSLFAGVSIIALVIVFYLPYYRDVSIFTNMLAQGTKYSQSILAFIMEKVNQDLFFTVSRWVIPVFAMIYCIQLITLLFKRKLSMKEVMQKYNFMMLLFIFGVLTTFQKWYLLWLIPTMIWQNKNMRKFILFLTATAIIPSMRYFVLQNDIYSAGIGYSIKILIFTGILLIINLLINQYLTRKEKKCHV